MKNHFLKDYILFLALQIQIWTRYNFCIISIWFSMYVQKKVNFYNKLKNAIEGVGWEYI